MHVIASPQAMNVMKQAVVNVEQVMKWGLLSSKTEGDTGKGNPGGKNQDQKKENTKCHPRNPP